MKLQGITPEMRSERARRDAERKAAEEARARESFRRSLELFRFELSVPPLYRPWLNCDAIRYW